jgi:hypothetical protein
MIVYNIPRPFIQQSELDGGGAFSDYIYAPIGYDIPVIGFFRQMHKISVGPYGFAYILVIYPRRKIIGTERFFFFLIFRKKFHKTIFIFSIQE